jgi:hypothetical protein
MRYYGGISYDHLKENYSNNWTFKEKQDGKGLYDAVVEGNPNDIQFSSSIKIMQSATAIIGNLACGTRSWTLHFGGTTSSKQEITIGKGFSQEYYISNSGEGLGAEEGNPNCFIIQGGTSFLGRGTVFYETYRWPYEKVINIDNSGNSGSSLQLANGFFTGPPTYRTVGSRRGIVILNKTSTSWATITDTITIDIEGPHPTQKSMPENFLWVAGGISIGGIGLRYEKVGIGYYNYRELGPIFHAYPAYFHFGITSIPSEHYTSHNTFSIGGQQFNKRYAQSQESYETRIGNRYEQSGHTHNFVATKAIPETGYEVKTKIQATTTWYDYVDSRIDQEEVLWPLIATIDTIYTKSELSKTTDDTPRRIVADGGIRPKQDLFSYSNESSYRSTTLGEYDAIYELKAVTNTTSISISGTGNEYYYDGKTENRYSFLNNDTDYSLTYHVELGYIHRKHETSKRGYFYTDTSKLYQNATEVDTWDVGTLRCLDARCIDVKRYADANSFQTATTYNNSLIVAKRKQPRNAERGKSDTLSLQDVQSFSTYETEKYVNSVTHEGCLAHGVHRYSLNPYGEPATYSYRGYKEVTYKDQSATKFIPDTSNTFFIPMDNNNSPMLGVGWVVGVPAFPMIINQKNAYE